ncbi:MAG: hypothetical protein B9S32_09990 [Verrucomicrobia bacterium Tous-C9LFEB]|nr:MAG: hypothetical protein B9S32_09990 [Verrucomicrobia bacterium Tous-C9LFEB]
MQIHLIGNAHLDPVWLWDWQEGLNEGITTVKTILDMMDEDSDLTFIRGEAVIYEHIEKNDPETFDRIRQRVIEGRWDVVGGTYLQPDTNLAGIETLARHFTRGQLYFKSRFGSAPKVAWQADSFGHTAGLPEVLAAAGIESFAFTRPDFNRLPLREPAFWWKGAGGARILCYRPMMGWYGSNRDEVSGRLDGLVAAAEKSQVKTVGCFYGLGNHGGGPSRQQLLEIKKWAQAHPEIEVIHSGLHRFFKALRVEVESQPKDFLPLHEGELNFCLRGCYSAAARLKYLYRRAEESLNRSEKTDSMIAALTERDGADLSEAWDGILFNSFHDILPGSSIERALQDQQYWLGSVMHTSQHVELSALNELALRVDTTVKSVEHDKPTGVSALVWNPHSYPFQGHIELEACLDYRPITNYRDSEDQVPVRISEANGKPLPFQLIEVENRSMTDVHWRKRAVVPVSIPAMGWKVIEMAWDKSAKMTAVQNPVTAGDNWVDNGSYQIKAEIGQEYIEVCHEGHSLFGSKGLSAFVVEDPWGSWGGMLEEPDSIHLNEVRETWKVTAVRILESGAELGRIWIRLAGAKSRLDLTFSLYRDRNAIDVSARIFWDERSARLKLNFPMCKDAEFEVPGAVVTRQQEGELPGGRWVRVNSNEGGFSFASNALYNFDMKDDSFRATIVRASRYADDVKTDPTADLWRPAMDLGELSFQFLIAPHNAPIAELASNLEQPPIVQLVTPKKGSLPREGSLASLQPRSLKLLALKRAENGNGFVMRAQLPAGEKSKGQLNWLGHPLELGELEGGKILSWQIHRAASRWECERVDIQESPLALVKTSPVKATSKKKEEELCPR